MILENKYTAPYIVPSTAIDGQYRCTPLTFAALSQDLAANHYSSTGLFLPHLHSRGISWVITKQHFEIYEYPLWLDSMVLQTWAQPLKGLFCFRDFAYYYAENGKKSSLNQAFSDMAKEENSPTPLQKKLRTQSGLCVRGSSCWLVIDMNTNQPIRPDNTTLGTLNFCPEHMDGRVFAKISLPNVWNKEEHFTPSLLDIDMNNHINNLHYIRWILSYMDIDFCKGKLLRTLDTNFLISAKYGDALCCCSAYLSESICVHSIIRTSDGNEIFRAQTEWTDETHLARPVSITT